MTQRVLKAIAIATLLLLAWIGLVDGGPPGLRDTRSDATTAIGR